MEIRLAANAGFCYGVERAVSSVCREIEQASGRVYTYGQIVHNEIVTDELGRKGVRVISDFDELKALAESGELNGASVVIRAHGVGLEVYELLSTVKDVRLVDATCPFVRKIHDIVKEKHGQGCRIIICGNPGHPEVKGILGQIGGDAIVLENTADAAGLAADSTHHFCVVAQTTFQVEKFKDIVDILKKTLYYVTIVNTICNATQLRQSEALELSRECDCMIVIGSTHSSNTAKLFEICNRECRLSYCIQSLDDLKGIPVYPVRCVGITAGASTPKSIIEEVVKYVRDEF